MSWKDKRKSENKPILNEKRVYVKLDKETQKLGFMSYDKESKININLGNEIKGVLLGTAMAMECYDSKFNKNNGGTYKTPYIFNTKNVACFSPTGNFEMSSDYKSVKEYMQKEAGANPRVFQVLFIYTGKSIIAVYTNISIAIGQLNKYQSNLMYNYININTEEYNKDTSDVDKKAKELMGKLANQNPPKFANITIGKEISDEWATECNLENIIDMFNDYKSYYSKIIEKPEDTTELPVGLDKKEVKELDSIVENYNSKATTSKSDDDLLF
jgi:hypothetical protein